MKKYLKIKREKIGTYIVFYNQRETKYIVSFKDINHNRKFIRVDSAIGQEYKRQKSEDNSYNIKFCRYIEHSNLSEYKLNERAINKIPSAEDIVIEQDSEMKIIEEIWKLPAPQNRRVYMKLIKEYSLTEIAKIEKRAIPVIKRSVDRGIEKLQEKLKKFLD